MATSTANSVSPAAPSARLGFWRILAFSVLGVPLSLLLTPLGTVLPTYYSENTGISIAAIGLALSASRIIDAFFDPVVGILVDRTKTRFGSRKPWIVAGVCVMLPAVFLLLNPPANASFAYLFVTITLVSCSYSLISIPYAAMGTVITEDYHERSRVVAWRTVAGFAGSLAFLTIPFLVSGETKIGPEVMRFASIGVGCAFPFVLAWFLWAVPDPPKPSGEPQIAWRDFIDVVKVNGPFRFFLVSMLVRGIGEGMFQGSFVLFVSQHLKMADRVPHMLGILNIVYLVATVAWARILPRLPKNLSVFWASVVFAVAAPFWLFVPAGQDGFPWLMAIIVVQAFAISATSIVLPSILADIIDYDTWKRGKSIPAMYFSTFLLTEKINLAIGIGVGLGLLALFGFKPGVTTSGLANIGGYGVVIVLPALFVLCSAVLWFRFPISEAKQRAMRTRINRREAELASVSAQTIAAS